MTARTRRFRHHLATFAACVALSLAGGAGAAGVETMTVEAAHEAAHDGGLILVDIRTPGEWRESGVPDVAVPLDMTTDTFLQDLMALRRTTPEQKLGLICATGGRSARLANWLSRHGVEGVVDVNEGVHGRDGWRARRLPLRKPGTPPETSSDRRSEPASR